MEDIIYNPCCQCVVLQWVALFTYSLIHCSVEMGRCVVLQWVALFTLSFDHCSAIIGHCSAHHHGFISRVTSTDIVSAKTHKPCLFESIYIKVDLWLVSSWFLFTNLFHGDSRLAYHKEYEIWLHSFPKICLKFIWKKTFIILWFVD